MSAKNVLDTIDIDTAFELIALEQLLAIRASAADAPQFRRFGN